MRVVCGVIVLIAAVVWGIGSRASVINVMDDNRAAMIASVALPLSGPTENNYTSKPTKNDVRLAQNLVVDAREATSGNPALVPLTWVGILVIPNPAPKSPNAVTLCTAEFITSTVLLTAGHCLQ